ncbi:MAG: carboxypeptidase-like regulatory domain-containing protein [Candidatus Latescibacteria bacterium]|nr:carboxypeptidase-like regulatory domain-containing protein [Candidatus Latescibacterota bacterium]
MFLRVLMWTLCIVILFGVPAGAEKVIRGVVSDAETGEPLPQGTVQVLGTYEGTITNVDGAYELVVRALPATLRVSYIGYESVEVVVGRDTKEGLNVALKPVPIIMDELVVTAKDMGPNIMRKVIAQKKTWWQNLSTFQVRAYSRFTYRNETDLVAVVESLADAYWDREKGWREVVKDKRETKNIDWGFSMPAAMAVNLYDDEIEIGGHYLVGVTHPDALDHYDFRLAGRRFLDRQVVYDIEVTPKNKLKSAFTGHVSVLDSVYAMIEAELAPNRAFLFPPPIRALGIEMSQQFSNTGGEFWLPIGYQSEVGLEIGMMGLQFPPIKARRVSRLSDYLVNVALVDSLYEKGRRPVTVDSVSVAQDSLMNKAGVVVPLTETEMIAYENIDSTMTLEKAYKPKGFLARFIDTDDDDSGGRRNGGKGNNGKRGLGMKWQPEVWFNRVDGAHLGLKLQTGSKRSRMSFEGTGAYNASLKRWAFSGGATGRLGEKRRGFVTVSGFRESQTRYASALYSRFMTSPQQVFGAQDYFDFFWNKGVRLRGGYHFRRPRLSISAGVNIERHTSLNKATDWSLFDRMPIQRVNPGVGDHKFRSVIARVIFAGRNQGPAPFFGQRKLMAEIEHSRRAWDSDYAFTQFRGVLDWRFETFFKRRLLSNVLDVRVVGSTFTGTLPRNKFGILDTWLDGFSSFGGFRARVDRPYEGEKLLGVFWEHNFRTVPFEIIGWQWAVRKNWSLLIHGGHGRTWISDHRLVGLNFEYTPQYRDRFHQEVGVSINGIFDLVRLNITKRLDTSGIYGSVEVARIF